MAVFWAISEEALREMLNRAHAGEDPDMLYMEFWANSDHEAVEGND